MGGEEGGRGKKQRRWSVMDGVTVEGRERGGGGRGRRGRLTDSSLLSGCCCCDHTGERSSVPWLRGRGWRRREGELTEGRPPAESARSGGPRLLSPDMELCPRIDGKMGESPDRRHLTGSIPDHQGWTDGWLRCSGRLEKTPGEEGLTGVQHDPCGGVVVGDVSAAVGDGKI